ncbi:hypothetical protein M0802_007184 [Mischocyttarus mexicanus]|nr:hypothetical protein M0802_007184 [Mischocyttarus mexicanus]
MRMERSIIGFRMRAIVSKVAIQLYVHNHHFHPSSSSSSFSSSHGTSILAFAVSPSTNRKSERQFELVGLSIPVESQALPTESYRDELFRSVQVSVVPLPTPPHARRDKITITPRKLFRNCSVLANVEGKRNYYKTGNTIIRGQGSVRVNLTKVPSNFDNTIYEIICYL